MARIESSIVVSKSVEDTFAFLNKLESHLKFIPNMVELNQTSAGSFGRVSTTMEGALGYFGIRLPVQYELIEHQPNKALAMKGTLGPMLFKDGYVLSTSGNGTQIKFWLELSLTGITKLLTPFTGLIGKIHAYETLNNLKNALEIYEPSLAILDER